MLLWHVLYVNSAKKKKKIYQRVYLYIGGVEKMLRVSLLDTGIFTYKLFFFVFLSKKEIYPYLFCIKGKYIKKQPLF